MNGKTLIQSIVFGLLIVLPIGATLGMPFSHEPPNGRESLKGGLPRILPETSPDRHLGAPPETLFPQSLDEGSFDGDGDRSLGRVDRGPFLMLPSVEGDDQLAAIPFIEPSWKRTSQEDGAGSFVRPAAAGSVEAVFEGPGSSIYLQDEVKLSPVFLFLTGLLLLALSGVVWRRAVKRTVVEKQGTEPDSIPNPSDS